MSKIQKLRTYLTSPTKCFIPKCKARCCIDAPLPEDFLPRMQSRIQRQIYSGANIGQNDPRDKFNSVNSKNFSIFKGTYQALGDTLKTKFSKA